MAGLRLTYYNPRLLRTLLIQLQQQQQAGLFCDVTLQGDGEGIDVHSCVIAACSPYLADLLTSPTEISEVSDSTRRVLKIHGLKSIHLFPLVQYMYTAELKVAPGDVGSVLQAAHKLQIPEVELLKLERGRLVRTDSGRRLNRSCLGTKTRTPYAKAENQGTKCSGTHIPMKPTRNSQNKIDNDVDNVSMQGNENTQDTETSSCGVSEIGSSDLGCLENVLSSCSSVEDFAGDHGYLENVPTSHDLLQYVHGTQNSQEDAPPIHNSINDIANSQDLTENALISQDFVQDFISNQNSPIAESLDLMESELKGLLDYIPGSQDLSEETVNVSGLHDNVPSIKESPEDVQSIGEFLKNIQSSEELLDDMQNIGKDALSTGGLSEEAQSIVALPEDAQSTGGLSEEAQSIVALPEDAQSTGGLSEEAQSIVVLPEDAQRVEELPETMLRSHALSENLQDTQENLLKRCRTIPPKRSKSNSEVMLDQEGECFSGQQIRPHTKSKTGLLKRIKLDRKNKEIAFCGEFLKFKCPDVTCSNIDISDKSEDMLDDHKLLGQCDKPRSHHHGHHLKHTAELKDQLSGEHAGHLVGLKVGQLRTEDKNALIKDGRANEAPIVSSEITDSPVNDENGNYSVPHTVFKSIKESWSGPIIEMNTGTVAHKGFTSSAHCGSESNRIVDHEGPPSSTNCESETSGAVVHDGLMTRTYDKSETIGSGNQEGLPSSTHCESDTSRTLDQDGLMTSTYSESETSGTGNQEGLPSSAHCKSERNGAVDQENVLSTSCKSKRVEIVDHKCLTSSTNYEYEPSRTVGQVALTSGTYHESERRGTVNPEGVPSSAYCECETNRIVVREIFSNTYCKSERDGIVDHDKSLDEFQKRCYIDSEEEKVNIKRTSDALSWEVKPLNVTCPSKGKEHFKELEEQVEQIIHFTTPMSPDVDVGVYSPPMFMEEHLWPDLSSESDMEIDVLE
ncbi:BTB/POZ domain-containing protein 18 [Bufo gargarizans]|uniref:BTB/POZ domain-containing protein 18 n=1 Tax=Bufo gargarizans TaxID=30331 RepID=UPI001CF3D236|nr:BTB/POZ domain-containing protein 18 [Bufo gargarizans]